SMIATPLEVGRISCSCTGRSEMALGCAASNESHRGLQSSRAWSSTLLGRGPDDDVVDRAQAGPRRISVGRPRVGEDAGTTFTVPAPDGDSKRQVARHLVAAVVAAGDRFA